MDSLLSDVRFATRALLARPGFSALAILTLAIGIGVNAVAFSALNGLLFKPFRFPGVDALGWVMTRSPGNPHALSSVPDYEDLARSARSFASLAAEGRMALSFHDGTRTRQVWGLIVSDNYLMTLGATTAIGRVFTPADRSTAEIPAVVSARFWTNELGGGDSIAGRTVTLNGHLVSIIGVIGDGFQGPGGLYEPDVWIPLDRAPALNLPARLFDREEPWLTVVGRLAPGVTAPQAGAELQSLAASLASLHRSKPDGTRTIAFAPMSQGAPELRPIARLAWIGLAIVSLVLLIACFNVAALLVARAADRQRDISVRTALGATRGRIIRQFAIEGVMLALISGAAAIVVAAWSADLLSAFSLPSPIPQRLHLGVDRRVIGFTVMLVAFAGTVPSLLPALQATRVNLVASIRMETSLGPRPSRMRNAFMVAQVAGSTLFLTAALLFLRGFWTQASTDPGFDTAHLLVLELKPSDFSYDSARSKTLFENLTERVQALPGVERVAFGDRAPFYVGYPKITRVSTGATDCATIECREVMVYGVGADYLSALGVPLVTGRDVTPETIASGDAVVVSQNLASRLFPDRPAVGEWVRDAGGRQLRVIGVAKDVTHRSFGETPREYLYRPMIDGEFADTVTLLVRTYGEPGVLIAAVQDQVRALDASLPPGSAKTMEARMEMPLWPARTAAGFLGVCGTLALTLATVGLFGLTYLTVSQRTREFGLRAALGASPRRVVTQVLREGIQLTAPGVALGLAGAAVATRFVSSALFGVSPADPSSYAVSAGIQTGVAIIACLLPALRATRADPMLALRVE